MKKNRRYLGAVEALELYAQEVRAKRPGKAATAMVNIGWINSAGLITPEGRRAAEWADSVAHNGANPAA